MPALPKFILPVHEKKTTPTLKQNNSIPTRVKKTQKKLKLLLEKQTNFYSSNKFFELTT